MSIHETNRTGALTGGGKPLPPAELRAWRPWSGDLYRQVVCSMDEGAVVVDLDENILFANPACARILGCQSEELPGMNLCEFLPAEDIAVVRGETQKRTRGLTSRYSVRVRRRDGQVREVVVNSSPLRDAGGEVVAATGVFMDVTEHRRAEEALARSEQDKAVILSSVSELVNYLDADMRIRWANRAAGESVGMDPAEMAGRFCYEIWHRRDRACRDCPAVAALESGRVCEGGMTSPDGRVWHIRGYPVRGNDGDVVGVVDVSRDITDAVRADEALRRYTERLEVLRRLDRSILSARSLSDVCQAGMECIRRLVQCLFVGVAEFDLQRGQAVVLATDSDKSTGRELVLSAGASFPLEQVRHLEQYEQGEVIVVKNLPAVAEPSPVEKKLLADGAKSYLAMPLLAEGQLIGVLCVGFGETDAVSQDVTEVAAEVANPLAIAIDRNRRETERARLAAAVTQVDEAVAIFDRSGRTEYVNQAAANIIGASRDDILKQKHISFLGDDQAHVLYQEMWQEVCGGRSWSGRANLRRADGSTFPAEVTCSPLKDVGGEIVSYVLVGRDVSQETAIEEQLRHSQKMEAIGRLAGGIAHDFNNLLTVVLGNAEMLQQSHGDDPAVGGCAADILRAGQRGADLTRQLLVFARKGQFRVAEMDLHDTVREVMALLKPGAGRRVEVTTDLSAERSRIIGDATQLQMALLNLGINACDAMDGGGKIAFATRDVTVDAGHAAAHMVPIGEYVEVSVSDTGSGMDENTRSRIFEPFFTTKPCDRGTGLGLPSVYGCVQYHGGAILVESAPGKGTTFRLLLPGVAAENESTAPPADRCRGHILLVDDEDTLRGFVSRVLTRAGYAVTDCDDPERAWKLFEQDPEMYSLVILDLVMPHLSGRELFRRMKQLRADVRVIITTSQGRDELVHDVLADGAVGVLPKPFDARALMDAVSRHIISPPASKSA